MKSKYFLAKFRFDTAENERAQICKIWQFLLIQPASDLPQSRVHDEVDDVRRRRPLLGGAGQERLGDFHDQRHLLEAGVRVVDLRRLGVRVSKIRKILQFFGGRILGCIKAKFCKKICV